MRDGVGMTDRSRWPSLVGLVGALVPILCCSPAPAAVQLQDRYDNTPLVLGAPGADSDYELRNVAVLNLTDAAAVTLTGQIHSLTMRQCRFGQVVAGPNGRAAALEAAGAAVGTLTASECYFIDAENQLLSLREGSFGTVRFERCAFRTSEGFLRRIYGSSPWRTSPPVMEFYNIQRLELLDNEYANTLIVIHPSVKQVILRGEVAGLQIANPQQTRVTYLDPEPQPTASAPMWEWLKSWPTALGQVVQEAWSARTIARTSHES